jgi:hypothetical protein
MANERLQATLYSAPDPWRYTYIKINMYIVIKQRKRGFNKFIELQRERIAKKSLRQR